LSAVLDLQVQGDDVSVDVLDWLEPLDLLLPDRPEPASGGFYGVT
jgi:hypothetical protein